MRSSSCFKVLGMRFTFLITPSNGVKVISHGGDVNNKKPKIEKKVKLIMKKKLTIDQAFKKG